MSTPFHAFQPDEAGAPGFQLAEDAGFQTQLAAPSTAAVGDLLLVLDLEAVTTGPRRPAAGGGHVALWIIPRRYHVVGDLAMVLALSGRTARRAAPIVPVRHRVAAAELVLEMDLASRVTYRDYVRDVLIPEDEELLLVVG